MLVENKYISHNKVGDSGDWGVCEGSVKGNLSHWLHTADCLDNMVMEMGHRADFETVSVSFLCHYSLGVLSYTIFQP